MIIGIVSIKYGFAPKDRQTYRQVQPETRYESLPPLAISSSSFDPFLLSADLVSMNETFVRARTIFDRMMEESLARHSGGAFTFSYSQVSPLSLPALLDL